MALLPELQDTLERLMFNKSVSDKTIVLLYVIA